METEIFGQEMQIEFFRVKKDGIGGYAYSKEFKERLPDLEERTASNR